MVSPSHALPSLVIHFSDPSLCVCFLFALGRDNWARTISPNPNVKVYVGAPASSTAAGTGYEAIGTLSSIAVQMRQSFPSFGGVMLWDASQAYGACASTPYRGSFFD